MRSTHNMQSAVGCRDRWAWLRWPARNKLPVFVRLVGHANASKKIDRLIALINYLTRG